MGGEGGGDGRRGRRRWEGREAAGPEGEAEGLEANAEGRERRETSMLETTVAVLWGLSLMACVLACVL